MRQLALLSIAIALVVCGCDGKEIEPVVPAPDANVRVFESELVAVRQGRLRPELFAKRLVDFGNRGLLSALVRQLNTAERRELRIVRVLLGHEFSFSVALALLVQEPIVPEAVRLGLDLLETNAVPHPEVLALRLAETGEADTSGRLREILDREHCDGVPYRWGIKFVPTFVKIGDRPGNSPSARVAWICSDGPSSLKGLRPGDVVSEVEGEDVIGRHALVLERFASAEHLEFLVRRDGRGISVNLGLEK